MIQFIIPFLYTHTYNRKNVESIAYILEYYVALFLLSIVYSNHYHSFYVIFITLIITICIYEIGYLQNNVFSIKKDKNPTFRHSQDELLFLEQNIIPIIAIRFGLIMFLISILYFIPHNYNMILFIILLLSIIFIFILYNLKFREGIIHRLLFAILRFLRYFSPIFFLGTPAFIFSLIIALVNFINHFSWYNRGSVHLHRFFGTKLFDAIIYGNISLYFISIHSKLYIIFTYLFSIKLLLFIFVFITKRKQ